MEYWLKNKDKSIQLPIRPASFNVTFENTHQTVNVQTRGDFQTWINGEVKG